ncbi:CPBP family intramembrane glutamic endopeptidase [Leptospira ilyithenensis]|uniref:CPBP family intramembrane metalloprotease n=1 Tax=Leptospira ilyithenensis TaxID=2484901 RepID=A0A4R9LQ08_9LEPT|nr:CPBP family intramembrane glutamic endopeptidase [Leptospira ilyithenensis]TGN11185.1 CPBP family intramembrane metalloprotease [Leptospira ilyithenensis]
MKEKLSTLLEPFRIYKKENPDYPFILFTYFIIALSITAEYTFEIGNTYPVLGVTLNYSIPFFLLILLHSFRNKSFWIFGSSRFWTIFFCIITALVISENVKIITILIRDTVAVENRYAAYKFAIQLKIWIFYGIPPLICYAVLRFLKKNSRELEDLERKAEIPITSYLLLLGPMVIVVFLAALGEDFQNYYPRAPRDQPMIGFQTSLPIILIFEIFYALAFVATEWFFRGFVIRILHPFFGKNAVLLMTVLYVAIHFEKPILETISSSVGGFTLGIYSYYTGKIRGGVLIHVGIALAMEIIPVLLRIT